MLLIKRILLVIVFFLLFVLTNNIVINLTTFFLGYNRLYLYGFSCEGGINNNGIIILMVFLFYKILVINLYLRKVKYISYFLVVEAIFFPAYLLDYFTNSNILGVYYSNRPIINISWHLTNSYFLAILYSVLCMIILIITNKTKSHNY